MSAPTPELDAVLAGPARWHTIDHRGDVGSTNDVAAAALAEGVPPGLVVVADRQLAGRGRRGRRWQDPGAGASLPVSVTLPRPATPTLVPLVGGLAALAAVEATGVEGELKWPNDVLVVGRRGGAAKLVGVLAEGTSVGIVLGIGVNVDLRRSPVAGATSVAEELERDVDRWALLAALLRALDSWSTALDDRREGAVLADYRERCRTLGREVVVHLATGDDDLRGRAVALTPAGGLVVEDAGGRRTEVTAGDVQHVRPG